MIMLMSCAADSAPPRAAPERPDAISLYALPVAINLDNQPGADGLRISLYAFRRTQPEPITLDSGRLEVRLYEGRLSGQELAETEPVQVWSFSAPQLRTHVKRTAAGPGYVLDLSWAPRPPAARVITLLARFYPTRGAPLESSPLSLAAKKSS
jgi:hypothetical protein